MPQKMMLRCAVANVLATVLSVSASMPQTSAMSSGAKPLRCVRIFSKPSVWAWMYCSS